MATSTMRALAVVVFVVAAVSADADAELSRQRRFAVQSCTVTPDSTAEKVVDRNQGIKISCNLDSTVQTCIWTHFEPQNEPRSRSVNADIMCSSVQSDSGRTCDTQSRISFQNSANQCGITISNSQPSDTGKWKLAAITLNDNLLPLSAEKEIAIYTYNQTKVRLADNRDQDVTTIETSYNYNTKEERWETGKGDWENVELRCQAFGGRPLPKFLWYIDNNDKDPLINGNDGIQVTETFLGNSDNHGFIRNLESRITFKIDDRFFGRLAKYNVNTNPSNGVISVELRCDPQQDLQVSVERPAVRLNIKRTYDDGNMKAGTIGLIVGVVIAVILVVVAIALLVFAKSSGRWCFADDEEAYRKPQEAKPRTAGGPPPAGHSAQRQRRQ